VVRRELSHAGIDTWDWSMVVFSALFFHQAILFTTDCAAAGRGYRDPNILLGLGVHTAQYLVVSSHKIGLVSTDSARLLTMNS
jgi:hypothetical protein